jgi:exodeoxyribonuclease V gamma subunit
MLDCDWSSDVCSSDLPLACKTAFAWLSLAGENEDKARAAARSCYEGGYQNDGERGEDAYLLRTFPDFDRLAAAGFETWLQPVYAPLRRELAS